MKLLLILLFAGWALVLPAQEELAVSFTGNYSIAGNNIKDNFKNGFGGTTEFYYSFDNSPFSLSLSFSLTNFAATDEVYRRI